jgi:lysophospholipase L1-like esterase
MSHGYRRWIFAVAAISLPAFGFPPAAPAQARAEEPPKPKPDEKPVDLGALFRMHYETRVRAFREQNALYQNVVLLGDSITEGFDLPKYFPGRRVLNRGIGADVIGNDMPENDPRGVLRRLDSSVFDCAATDLFLMIGINDLNSGRSVDQMEAGYRELLRAIRRREPTLRIHVQSLLPTRGGFAERNAAIVDFNRRLSGLAEEVGADYLDLHRLFADAEGQLRAEYTEDGLHLTEPAYLVWKAEVERIMGWKDAPARPADGRPG